MSTNYKVPYCATFSIVPLPLQHTTTSIHVIAAMCLASISIIPYSIQIFIGNSKELSMQIMFLYSYTRIHFFYLTTPSVLTTVLCEMLGLPISNALKRMRKETVVAI
jgi:hypothetical protein